MSVPIPACPSTALEGSCAVRVSAGRLEVFWFVRVIVEATPGWYCWVDGAQVLPTAVSMRTGMATVTSAEALTGSAVVASADAVFFTATPFEGQLAGRSAGTLRVSDTW